MGPGHQALAATLQPPRKVGKRRARRAATTLPAPHGHPEPPAQVRARGPRRGRHSCSRCLGAGADTHHNDSRSHSWSSAKSKLSMVRGDGAGAEVNAVAAASWAARALQRKAPLKVRPGRGRP